MKREIIKFNCWQEIAPLFEECITESEEFDVYYNEDGDYLGGIIGLDNFILVDYDIYYVDLEKSYIEREVIIQRNSDNKYFRGKYNESLYWSNENKFPLEFVEVFLSGTYEKKIFK